MRSTGVFRGDWFAIRGEGVQEPLCDTLYMVNVFGVTGNAGDQYNGVDRFGRVVDQRWLADDGSP
jgi:hypothetical protein